MYKWMANRKSAFTLVELMIVVVIVAILALVAIPLYQGNVTAAKMSEGIAGVGTVRTALRVYAASHSNSYPVLTGAKGDALSAIGISATDLNGKYFQAANYEVTSTAATYTITATLASDTSKTYKVDQAGVESGTYKTE